MFSVWTLLSPGLLFLSHSLSLSVSTFFRRRHCHVHCTHLYICVWVSEGINKSISKNLLCFVCLLNVSHSQSLLLYCVFFVCLCSVVLCSCILCHFICIFSFDCWLLFVCVCVLRKYFYISGRIEMECNVRIKNDDDNFFVYAFQVHVWIVWIILEMTSLWMEWNSFNRTDSISAQNEESIVMNWCLPSIAVNKFGFSRSISHQHHWQPIANHIVFHMCICICE